MCIFLAAFPILAGCFYVEGTNDRTRFSVFNPLLRRHTSPFIPTLGQRRICRMFTVLVTICDPVHILCSYDLVSGVKLEEHIRSTVLPGPARKDVQLLPASEMSPNDATAHDNKS